MTTQEQVITIASRIDGFAWAGRQWGTEPVLVRVGDQSDGPDNEPDDELARITPGQFAELQRQCEYPRFPLSIGAADSAALEIGAARSELDAVRADIEAERGVLDGLKADVKKLKRQLKDNQKKLDAVQRELAEAKDARLAAEKRAQEAEAKLSPTVQVEDKPDPNRERN